MANLEERDPFDGRDRTAARPRRWPRDGSGPLFGALDLGTNNCRLLIAEQRSGRDRGDGARLAGQFRVVDAFSRVVRLGEGLDASGCLSEAAMERALSALKICARKLRRRGLVAYRAVATEACRRAANHGRFLELVAESTGLALEVISQEEEAGLAIHGCSPLMDPGVCDVLVFDIGGGSTQVSWLRLAAEYAEAATERPPRLARRAWCSLPLGVVTLAERYGGRDIGAEAYRAMVAEVAAGLAPFEARHGLAALAGSGRLQMLGTSGTVTTLAGMHQNLRRYDRSRVDGSFLELATIRRLSAEIAAMSYDQRLVHPCIGGQRADLVVAGCAILEALCGIWPVARLRVADRGLREGILYSLMHDRAGRQVQWPGGAAAPPLRSSPA